MHTMTHKSQTQYVKITRAQYAHFKMLDKNCRATDVQLKGEKSKELDKVVTEGLREYESGKARQVKSLADLDD